MKIAENAANTLLEMLELCFPFNNEPVPDDPSLQMFTRRFPEVLRFELSEIFRNSEYTQGLANLLVKNVCFSFFQHTKEKRKKTETMIVLMMMMTDCMIV